MRHTRIIRGTPHHQACMSGHKRTANDYRDLGLACQLDADLDTLDRCDTDTYRVKHTQKYLMTQIDKSFFWFILAGIQDYPRHERLIAHQHTVVESYIPPKSTTTNLWTTRVESFYKGIVEALKARTTLDEFISLAKTVGPYSWDNTFSDTSRFYLLFAAYQERQGDMASSAERKAQHYLAAHEQYKKSPDRKTHEQRLLAKIGTNVALQWAMCEDQPVTDCFNGLVTIIKDDKTNDRRYQQLALAKLKRQYPASRNTRETYCISGLEAEYAPSADVATAVLHYQKAVPFAPASLQLAGIYMHSALKQPATAFTYIQSFLAGTTDTSSISPASLTTIVDAFMRTALLEASLLTDAIKAITATAGWEAWLPTNEGAQTLDTRGLEERHMTLEQLIRAVIQNDEAFIGACNQHFTPNQLKRLADACFTLATALTNNAQQGALRNACYQRAAAWGDYRAQFVLAEASQAEPRTRIQAYTRVLGAARQRGDSERVAAALAKLNVLDASGNYGNDCSRLDEAVAAYQSLAGTWGVRFVTASLRAGELSRVDYPAMVQSLLTARHLQKSNLAQAQHCVKTLSALDETLDFDSAYQLYYTHALSLDEKTQLFDFLAREMAIETPAQQRYGVLIKLLAGLLGSQRLTQDALAATQAVEPGAFTDIVTGWMSLTSPVALTDVQFLALHTALSPAHRAAVTAGAAAAAATTTTTTTPPPARVPGASSAMAPASIAPAAATFAPPAATAVPIAPGGIYPDLGQLQFEVAANPAPSAPKAVAAATACAPAPSDSDDDNDAIACASTRTSGSMCS